MPEFRDNNISNHCLGKKEKDYRGKKIKGQLRHTSWKKSRDMQSVGQKNKNPPQNAAMLQLQKVLNRANYKNEIASKDYPTTISPKTAPQGT